jgi:hypothetical protein
MCPDVQRQVEKFSQSKKKEIKARMGNPHPFKRGKNNRPEYPHIEE